MADLQGTWVPENDVEMEFISVVGQAAQQAYEQDVPIEDITGGLNFVAASVAMHDAPADREPSVVEETAEQMTDCPNCGDTIEDVDVFMGGKARVYPCRCEMNADDLGNWVDMAGGSADE